jgi:hypothetical protein
MSQNQSSEYIRISQLQQQLNEINYENDRLSRAYESIQRNKNEGAEENLRLRSDIGIDLLVLIFLN